MKKITSLVIGCSLALAGGVMAQAPEASPSPGAKGKTNQHEQHTPAAGENRAPGGAAPGQGQGQAQRLEQTPAAGAKQHGHAPTAPGTEHGASQTTPGAPDARASQAPQPPRGKGAGENRHAPPQSAPSAAPQGAPTGEAAAQPSPSAAAGKQHGRPNPTATAPGGAHGKHNEQAPGTSATPATAASAAPSAAPSAAVTASPKAAPSATTSAMHSPASPSATASASATAATTSTSPAATAATTAVAAQGTPKPDSPAVTKKPAPQQVQQIKQQTASFRAQPRPEIAPPVQFNPSYRIANAERWQGPQYEVYRNYHPERHDAEFYRSRYQRVELIGGGYYYFNNGYWYPAWGYNPSNEYYAYDAPIYVGRSAEPADRMIASVQAELKDMGYYKGEVDGLLGPLTRRALLEYQTDAGLQVTEVIDEPTLDSLNLAS